MLTKGFCFILFSCFALKNVTSALHPFAPDNIYASAGLVLQHNPSDSETSLLGFLATIFSPDTTNDHHKLSKHKLDKQLSSRQQFQIKNSAAKNDCEYSAGRTALLTLKHLTENSRKFSVPAHYHFLFRLTPF